MVQYPLLLRHYDAQTFSNLIEEFDNQTKLTSMIAGEEVVPSEAEAYGCTVK